MINEPHVKTYPPNNWDCPACTASRCHTAEEEAEFHPYAKHGFNGEHWTHPDLPAAVRAPQVIPPVKQ